MLKMADDADGNLPRLEKILVIAGTFECPVDGNQEDSPRALIVSGGSTANLGPVFLCLLCFVVGWLNSLYIARKSWNYPGKSG